jgi:hypothetical protein
MAQLDFTDAVDRKLTTHKAQEIVWDKGCKGLLLGYSRTGKKSWVVQRRGKRKAFGTFEPGAAKHLPLAAARRLAGDTIKAIDDAIDNPAPPPLYTLETGLENHLQGMRNKGRSERSIIHLRDTAYRYLGNNEKQEQRLKVKKGVKKCPGRVGWA